MSPWPALLTAVALLALPRLLRPYAGSPPEIRGPLTLLWWVNRLYCGAWHRLEIVNEAPLPRTGPALLIANHTCGVDNFLLQAGCRRILGFVITQEWYDFPALKPFCRLVGAIPVRRDGRDTAGLRAALRALDEGRVVPIFPEGKIHPDSGRSFLPPRPGAAFLALRSGVPVIPAYISGTPPTRNIWAALYTPSHARVVFGPPVDLSEYRSGDRVEKEAISEVAERLMASIRALRDEGTPDRPPAARGR